MQCLSRGDTLRYIFDSSSIRLHRRWWVSKRISKPNQTTQCITDYLCTSAFNSLLDDEYKQRFYSKILEDPTLIPGIKKDPEWTKVFNEYKKEQSMISGFYKDVPSSERYHHTMNEMEKIDCLIVDIDGSITYNEFQDLYGNYVNTLRKLRTLFVI